MRAWLKSRFAGKGRTRTNTAIRLRLARFAPVLAAFWICVGWSHAADGPLAFQRLIAFSFSDDGTQPGSLIQGADGCLYGTTSGSRSPNLFTNGTVFKLTPQGEVRNLASFDFNGTNGYYPGSLVEAADGNLYGTTLTGGLPPEVSYSTAIFSLAPAGVLSTLVAFDRGSDPATLLIRGVDGNLYG